MDERYYYLYESIIICVDVNEGVLFQFYIFFLLLLKYVDKKSVTRRIKEPH